MSLPARLSAIVIFAVAGMSLRLQFDASVALIGSGPATLWVMAGYFTILTNLAIALMMAGAATRFAPVPRLAGALTLAIVMIGIVYHLVLAGLWAPVGTAWWADQGLHTAVPVLTLLWWLTFAARGTHWRDLPVWLIWPVIYTVYAVIRGGLTGFWPYPFLDAATLGWPRVAANGVVLAAAFAVLGATLIALARRLAR